MLPQLEKDSDGNVITKPICGWQTRPVADRLVLMALAYYDSEPDMLEDEPSQLQFLMTPKQALELIRALEKLTGHLLSLEESQTQH